MAIATRARFKPDTNRDGQQTLVSWSDRSAGQGTVYQSVQIVAYDDADPNVASWANYIPGSSAYEPFITVLDEDVLSADFATVAAMTAANATAFWQAALLAWASAGKANLAGLVKCLRASKRLGPQVIP